MHEPLRNVLVAILLGAAVAPPARAVAQDRADATSPAVADRTEGRRWWNGWSSRSDQDRVLWFMTTLHVNHIGDGLSNDELGGLIYRGLYVVTLETTHGNRAYTIGVERSWLSADWGALGGMVGFRAGLIYGYDRKLGWIAEAVRILPVAQPVVYGRIGRITFDLSYTRVVLSLTAGFRF